MFAQSLGDQAVDRAIKVWYAAATDRRLSSSATFSDFAALTIDAAGRYEATAQAKAAWAAVGL